MVRVSGLGVDLLQEFLDPEAEDPKTHCPCSVYYPKRLSLGPETQQRAIIELCVNMFYYLPRSKGRL